MSYDRVIGGCRVPDPTLWRHGGCHPDIAHCVILSVAKNLDCYAYWCNQALACRDSVRSLKPEISGYLHLVQLK